MKKKREHTPRARFAKDIVCEFMPPTRKSNRVLILCAGAPVYPGRRADLLPFFAAKGYWVFLPRYRGTWESGGVFLKKSPHKDILDVMSGISRGFVNLETGKRYRVARPHFFIIGSSFGGPAALLASQDRRVEKVVALSPVIDWSAQRGTTEPLPQLDRTTPLFWGMAYRGSKDAWRKLGKSATYSPKHHAGKISGEKIIVFHAKDDDVVPFAPTRAFAKRTHAALVPLRTGGHLGLGYAVKPRCWKRIARFFNAR